MIGQFPLAAEVAGAAAEPGAEQQGPDPVGGHAGGELTRAAGGDRRDQPMGEIGPRAAARRAETAEECRDGRLDERAGFIHPVATRQDADVAGRFERLRDHELPIEPCAFGLEHVELNASGDDALRLGLRWLGLRRQHERRQLGFERVDLRVELGGP